MRFRFSEHARAQIRERHLSWEQVMDVLDHPQQVVPEHRGRRAYQSRVGSGTGRTLLLRVIVDETADPPVVVTVYRTSRIAKYWRPT